LYLQYYHENKKTVRLHYKVIFAISLILLSKYENQILLTKIKHPSKKVFFRCFILESNRPSGKWQHSSPFPAPVEVDSDNDCRNISRYSLVAGATAFNFPLVFTATSANKLTFTAFNAVGM
jgi:hypothetical protein